VQWGLVADLGVAAADAVPVHEGVPVKEFVFENTPE